MIGCKLYATREVLDGTGTAFRGAVGGGTCIASEASKSMVYFTQWDQNFKRAA